MIALYSDDFGRGFEAANRIFAVIERKSAIDITSKSGEYFDIKGRIEFVNVSFSYPNRDTRAIDNFLS